MAVSSPPSCAYSCVYNAALATNCLGYSSCLCVNQTYLNAAKACVQSLCDATDQTLWTQYGEQSCANVGIVVNLTVTNSQGQATATGTPSPSATSATSLVNISTTLTNGDGVATNTAGDHPSTNTQAAATSPNNPSATPASSSSGPTSSSSDSGSGSGGLSVGDKATIAGSVIGGLSLILALVTFILDRHGKYPSFFDQICCREKGKSLERGNSRRQSGAQRRSKTQTYPKSESNPISYGR